MVGYQIVVLVTYDVTALTGAIVTRLAAIEDMAGMTVLCSDKTGTLTLNKMVIQEETPVYLPNETQYTILRYAAMAAKWKEVHFTMHCCACERR
jgi:P-type E1-E2 ATPase